MAMNGSPAHPHSDGLHEHAHDHPRGHSHGVIDPAIASTERGIWALKWSFFGLLATALLQLAVELNVGVKPNLSVAEGHSVAKEVRHRILHHVPHVSGVTVHVDPASQLGEAFHRMDPHAHDGLPVHSHG
jgi:hypothetical protein